MFIPIRLTPVTVIILAITLLIYYMQQKMPHIIEPLMFISQYVNTGLYEIHTGQYWRLVSPVFLHFGLMHIAFNSLIFLQLGQIIEWRFNYWHLLLLFLVLAIISNFAQYMTSGPYFGGLSGIVYGLFGFVWIQGEINKQFGMRLPRQFVILFLFFFALFWLDPLKAFGVHIANSAHSAGLISGIVLALCYFVLKVRCRPIMRR